MKNLTLRQLTHFRGEQPNGKIYVAIKGEVFDVTASRHLYGKGKQSSQRAVCIRHRADGSYSGGAYEVLAGCEIARALAMLDLEETGSDRTSDLNKDQKVTLKEWIEKFQTKYKTVGKVSAFG